MNLIVINKNEYGVSGNPEDALASYCVDCDIVVAVYNRHFQVGGMLRLTQPDSRANLAQAKLTPARFADSGLAALIDGVCRKAAGKEHLSVRVAGGAGSRSGVAGKQNYLAVRKNLWKLGVFVQSEAVGGTATRSVRLEIGTGTFWVNEATGAEGELDREVALQGADPCLTAF